jgi:hypothetical protein
LCQKPCGFRQGKIRGGKHVVSPRIKIIYLNRVA